ncbi:hypothetical protein BDM02DRAFT_3126119 [Thelephora ganbajun]|uniref:Uncharacterized protein n=1 Tax=Thelephora ganbajun TaxID=370292 RepID=A0ACB6ZSU0_THEGA|nr:hypothetical protein BDM02DRAFT_3126119 [Thelephora ganbajun]
MAATPSSSSSRAPRNKHADSFRPQFPINPFDSTPRPTTSSTSSSLSEPWMLRPDRIPFSTAYRRDVVLVLGIPSESCVAALLASHSLVHSLVIFASHRPPTLPPSHAPAVRILLLASPLAIEDAGSDRLFSTLEWAERVARVWRSPGSDSADVISYEETTKDVPAPAPGSFSRNSSSTSGSVESLSDRSSKSRRGLATFSKRYLPTGGIMSGFRSSSSLPPIDPLQRPFDAILNYISHDVAEKHVLKQTILVTSITRAFLAPTLSPYTKLSDAKKNSRRNSSGRIYSLPPTPPYQSGDLPTQDSSNMTAVPVLPAPAMPPPPSRMVHIVPPTAPIGLIRSLDSFLSSFSRQAAGAEEVDHAKQYILNSSTVQEIIVHPHLDQDKCTILDLILLGGLDSVSGKSWVASGQDILFLPTSASSSVSSTLSAPRKSALPPPRTLSESFKSVDPVPPPRARLQSSPKSLLLFSSGSSTQTRGGDNRTVRHSSPVSEQDGFIPSDLQFHSHPVRHPRPHSLFQPPSLGVSSRISSGRAMRRSRLNVITKPDDPDSSTSGLPTPPDSEEDARHTSPQSLASEVLTPRKKKSRWQFWKS